jgi:hypothetical protein
MDTTFYLSDAEYVDTKLGAEAEEIAGTDESDVDPSQTSINVGVDDLHSTYVERGSWSRDKIFAYRTDTDGTEQAFDLTKLPQNVIDHTSFIGFSVILGRSKDRDATYASLVAGNITTRKPAGPKVVKLSDWRLAIASAMVDATKKAEFPLTLDAAKAKAIDLTTEQVRALKTDAGVIKHYNKAKGIVGGLSALLGA